MIAQWKMEGINEVASQIGEHYIFVKEERAERQLDRRATGWQTLALHVPAV